MNVKVSVIMPSLNVASYIDECMQSVLSQTLGDIEVLCIDAGSTDGTIEKLQAYADSDSRVKLIHSTQRSYGYQVNLGISVATGEYIAIVETDDFIKANMYETLYFAAEKTNANVVKANFYSFVNYGNGKRIWEKNDIANTSLSLFMTDINIWSGVYKRKFIIENNISLNETPGAAFQDIGFVVQVHLCEPNILFIQEYLYCYRMDRDESSIYSKNVIKYVYDEFVRLENKLNDQIEFVAGANKRFAQSFICELTKSVKANDCSIDGLEQYIGWAIPKLRYLLDNDSFWKDNLVGYKSIIEKIISGEYAQKLKMDELCSNENSKRILASLAGEKVILFGMGIQGRTWLKTLIKNNKNVICLTDNNKELWTTKSDIFEGFCICSPIEAVCTARKENAIFLVTSIKYGSDIKEQLIELGMNKERVVTIS